MIVEGLDRQNDTSLLWLMSLSMMDKTMFQFTYNEGRSRPRRGVPEMYFIHGLLFAVVRPQRKGLLRIQKRAGNFI
jgi:hypothetical protein